MRLRTYESFWLIKNGLLYSYPLLEKNINTSIAVIGGGITGALISDALVQAGYKVVLLDKRDIGQGSTSATTSMLQYEVDTPLTELSGMIGEKEAAYCYSQGRTSIRELEKLVKKYRIHCDFQKKRSLYFAHNKKAALRLQKEFDIRDKYALGVQWLTPAQVRSAYGIICEGAILSDTAASVDAYRLAHELIQHNIKKGMEVYDQTEIVKMNFRGRRPQLTTAEGCVVRCDRVIFCTGFESTLMLKEKVADLFFTYASISEPGAKVKKELPGTLVWNTADPYLYMRTTGDGRIIVGGEDTDTHVEEDQQKKKEKAAVRLQKKLEQTIPGIHFIEDFSWSGTFGSTKDGLPYIGASPEYKNAIFVLGFGGNGITFSVQGRKIVTDLLEGRENKLAYYYRFGR